MASLLWSQVLMCRDGNSPLPMSHKADEDWGQLPHNSPISPLIVMALLYCSGGVQSQLSQVLQLVGIRDGSPTLMTKGSSLPSAPGIDSWKGWQLSSAGTVTRQMRNWDCSPMLILWGWLTHIFANRAGSILSLW